MARNYTQVLEDVVKNQSVQLAMVVSENEQLKEQITQANAELKKYQDANSSSTDKSYKSGGQQFSLQEVVSDYERESDPIKVSDN